MCIFIKPTLITTNPHTYTMNIESLREICLSMPLATEDMPFDDTVVVFRVLGKIFTMIALDDPDWVVMKCRPDIAVELRERYPEITPAYHMNKTHWNQINIHGNLPDALITSMIRHSYAEVASKFTRKTKLTNPEIFTIQAEEKYVL